jgi:hypothetical protein
MEDVFLIQLSTVVNTVITLMLVLLAEKDSIRMITQNVNNIISKIVKKEIQTKMVV